MMILEQLIWQKAARELNVVTEQEEWEVLPTAGNRGRQGPAQAHTGSVVQCRTLLPAGISETGRCWRGQNWTCGEKPDVWVVRFLFGKQIC